MEVFMLLSSEAKNFAASNETGTIHLCVKS